MGGAHFEPPLLLLATELQTPPHSIAMENEDREELASSDFNS